MSDPRTKAKHLIALALNKGAAEGESSSAALAACRLIEKHKLLDDVLRPSPTRPASPGPWGRPEDRISVEDLDEFFRNFGRASTRTRPVPPPPPRTADATRGYGREVKAEPVRTTGKQFKFRFGDVTVIGRTDKAVHLSFICHDYRTFEEWVPLSQITEMREQEAMPPIIAVHYRYALIMGFPERCTGWIENVSTAD